MDRAASALVSCAIGDTAELEHTLDAFSVDELKDLITDAQHLIRTVRVEIGTRTQQSAPRRPNT